MQIKWHKQQISIYIILVKVHMYVKLIIVNQILPIYNYLYDTVVTDIQESIFWQDAI